MTISSRYVDIARKDYMGFVLPNEDPHIFGPFCSRMEPDRTLGIASGGETALFSLVPYTKNDVIIVDRAKGSARALMAKSIMLEQCKTDKIRYVLSRGPFYFDDFLDSEIRPSMPEHLLDQDQLQRLIHGEGWMHHRFRELWDSTPDSVLDKAREKLEVLTVFHADISQMRRFGPFDCVYTSNALNYRGNVVSSSAIASMVNPGGNVLASSSDLIHRDFREVGSDSRDGWMYKVYRKSVTSKRPENRMNQ